MAFGQALAHPEAQGLKAALIDELKSLLPSEHNTWEEFLGREKDIPKGRLISSKATFSIDYNLDGSFKKYKARLDDLLKSKSTDTYSLTISSQATRLFLGIIAEHDLDLLSFDVKPAFLYTRFNEFSEWIYMRRPEGTSDTEMPAIVRLLRGLYGLDIASKLFEEHFSNTLTTKGFKRLISDPYSDKFFGLLNEWKRWEILEESWLHIKTSFLDCWTSGRGGRSWRSLNCILRQVFLTVERVEEVGDPGGVLTAVAFNNCSSESLTRTLSLDFDESLTVQLKQFGSSPGLVPQWVLQWPLLILTLMLLNFNGNVVFPGMSSDEQSKF